MRNQTIDSECYRVVLHWTDKKGRARTFSSKPLTLAESDPYTNLTDAAEEALEASHGHEIDHTHPTQEGATECL